MARSFNGTSQAMQSAATIDLSAANQITIAFWMYWTAFANNDQLALETSANYNSNTGALLIDPNGSAANQFEVAVRVNSGGGFSNYRYFTRPTAGAWHQYVITFDRTAGLAQVVAVYVDGISQSLTTLINGDGSSGGGYGNLQWNFMSRNAASLWGNGRIAEFAIWSGVNLTNAEAASLAKGANPSQIRPASLARYWPCYGTSAPERNLAQPGPARGLNLIGSPPQVAHSPNPVIGSRTAVSFGMSAIFQPFILQASVQARIQRIYDSLFAPPTVNQQPPPTSDSLNFWKAPKPTWSAVYDSPWFQSAPLPPGPTVVYRDDDAYVNGPLSMVSLLKATGEFSDVVFARETNNGTRVASETGSVAIVTPGKNAKLSSQPNPFRKLRQANYVIEIQVSRDEPEDAQAEADRLFAVVHNALNNVSLGGFTLFDQSVLNTDYYTARDHPVVKILARGVFGYVVDLSSGGFRVTT